MKKWNLLSITTDEVYILDNVNVFLATPTNRYKYVKDPIYNQRYRAEIYIHKGKTRKYHIAIAEVSPSVYAIYNYS